MKRATILSAILALTLAGCGSAAAAVSGSPSASPSASASASVETESLNDQYTNLPVDNAFTLLTEHQDVEDMLNHGTGVLFFGFPECPWCQYYVPMLNEDAQSAGVNVKYYNIYVDKTANRTWYDSIADLLDEKDSEITHYDNDGKKVIYMPLVIFLHDGEIIGFDDETCDLDSDEIAPADYWTDEKISALHERLSSLLSKVKEFQDEGNKEGCAVKASPDC
ncbi:MAG: thioredoxin family protein [Lactimicrobium sp.]|uniref:thioredoxin family protein n=1 Tax=Lactimicrobium sp. TaxID=2563780 RepID=UPI002F358889